MKKILNILLILITWMTLVACGDAAKTDINIKTVNVVEFKKYIEKKDTILIDLRTKEELQQTGVIDLKVINLDTYDSEFPDKINELNRNETYLIYCRSGHRSASARKLMRTLWFKNIIELKWWIINWTNSGEKLWKLWETKNQEKIISLEEVKKHNKNSDCWTIIENKIYDITSFFGKHSWWNSELEILCWIDWTKSFLSKHWGSDNAKNRLKDFYIWDLK